MRFAVKKINPGRQRKTVALVKGKPSRSPAESAYSTTKKAIDILFESDRSFENSTYEVYRKTVMVKPNLIMPKAGPGPSNMTNTDPQACRAVVDWLIQKEAKRILFAESQVWEGVDPWELCGYRDVFEEEPYEDIVEFVDLNNADEDFIDIDYEMSRDFYTQEDIAFLKGFLQGREIPLEKPKQKLFQEATSTAARFNKCLKEARVLVNVGKLTTHVQTGASLAVKNLFPFLQTLEHRSTKHLGMDPFQRDLTYNEFLLSSLNLQRSIACVAAAYRKLRIPQLSIIDGIVAQEENGPLDSGKPREENLIAASWNCPATLDTIITQRFMGLESDGKPFLPPHVQWASGLGLGTRDESEICLILAREDGIPASGAREMRTEPDRAWQPPSSFENGISPHVYPRDTLLPVVTRARDYLEEQGIDPSDKVEIVSKKLEVPNGLVSC